MGLVSQLKAIFTGGSPPPSLVDLGEVSTKRLKNSLAAGREVQSVLTGLAAEGHTVIDLVMNGNAFEHWQMYPWQGGILDQRNHSQYFYHAHDDYKGEHGHFHTFYYQQRKLAHLVAFGMDDRGGINQLYTFNRWGPGDHYFPAGKLKSLLPKFNIGRHNEMDGRLHRFVNQALLLFQPEIEHLFDERDATFSRYRERNNGASPYEDRDLEITSAVPVNVDSAVDRIAEELRRRGEEETGPGASPATGKGTGKEVPDAEGERVEAGEITQPQPLEKRPLAQLKRSHEAGLALRKIAELVKKKGTSVLEMVMNGKEYEHWAMYPWDNGVIDEKTRSQYFYHSHPQSPEHGHFHIFYSHRNQLAHLVTLSLDNQGEALELFTVNRWVTGDFYLPAAKLKSYLTQFRITGDVFDREVNEYVRNMLILYQAEIGALMHQRDEVFAQYRARHNGRAPFEDRDLDVTSSLSIRIEGQTARLEAELQRRGKG